MASQSEMEPSTVVALVGASTVDFRDLDQVAGDDSDLGSDAATISSCSNQNYLQPMVVGL